MTNAFNRIFTIIESSRLIMHCLRGDDFSVLFNYRNDPAAKYQSWTDKSAAEITALSQNKKYYHWVFPVNGLRSVLKRK